MEEKQKVVEEIKNENIEQMMDVQKTALAWKIKADMITYNATLKADAGGNVDFKEIDATIAKAEEEFKEKMAEQNRVYEEKKQETLKMQEE